MNLYPSWIHRIPEMLEALALLHTDRLDRQMVESLFNLRKTAAFHLLRRLGAQRCGHSLGIGRACLMARLRELQEHPEWRWEQERRIQIGTRIDNLNPSHRRSLVSIDAALQQQIDGIAIAGLPDSIQFSLGCLTIRCRDMADLMKQLVLVAKVPDTDYEAMQMRIESAPSRKPVNREHAAASSSQTG